MAIFRRSWPEGHSPLLRADLPGLCTIGTFGIAVNQVCFLVGLWLTRAGHAAMVIGLTPFLVLDLALYRKQEVFTGQRAAGLLVAVAGLFLLQKPSASSQSASLLGDMMIVGAGVSFAFYTVFGKDAARKHGGMA